MAAGSVKKDEKTNTWYFVVDIGKSPTGKRIQKKKRGFKTKKDAEKALNALLNEVNNGTYIEPAKTLFGEYLIEYMKDKRHSISRQTADINESYMRTHILPGLGHIPLSKLTALHIQKFITELKDKGLADSTVKRIFNIVNASLNKAEKMQLIPKNVAALVDKPKVKRKEMQVWDVDQVKRFLSVAAMTTRYYIAFHLALATGMRQGEILGLRWSDIDFDNKLISVRQTLSHDGKELMAGAKTKSSVRTIAIDDDTVAALKKHRKMIWEERIKAGELYQDHGLVVCTELGKPTLPRSLKKIHDVLIKKAGLPKITFHDLRHTHASLMLKQNIHPKIVSERLGHSSIQMTLDTYSHLLPNMQQDAAQEIGKVLFKSSPNNPVVQEQKAVYGYLA